MKKKVLIIGIVIALIVGGSVTVNHFVNEKNNANDGNEVTISKDDDKDDDYYYDELPKKSESDTNTEDDSKEESTTSDEDDKKEDSENEDSKTTSDVTTNTSDKKDNPTSYREDNNRQTNPQTNTQPNKPASNQTNPQTNTQSNKPAQTNSSNTSTTTTKPKVVTYVVKFDSDGGTAVLNQIVNSNETAYRPSNPTKTGYTFNGWLLNGVKYSFSTKVNSNITLKASWNPNKYTVTYKDGDTVISTQSVNYNGTASKPTNPSKIGYTFAGWMLNGNSFDFNTKITSPITLQAKWVINYYSVEFDSNGGSSVETALVSHNETVEEPANPTKTGYIFAGWTLNGNSFDFNTKITGSITLKAVWIAGDYVVKFNSNGGSSVLSQAVSYNGTVTKPANPTRTGYTFSGWTLNGESFDFNTKITNNITLTATWTINKYTVAFDSDGGSSVASQTVNYNAYATVPTAPTKTGYTFGGWALNGSIYSFSSSKVTSNITLKATWVLNKYTVTFDSDGGTSIASQTVSHNGVATQPTNPTKTGYTFNGWTLNGANYNFSTKVTGAITLKASWTINKYTVTFKDDNNVVATQTVSYNGTATNYTGVSKIGNRLAYWKLGDNKYDFSTKVTSNTTLTAHWLPNFSGITECNVSSNLMSTSNYTTTDSSLKLYRCIVDYGMISPQNFAITSKYVYFNYAKDGAWTKTPEVDSELARVSRNYIYRVTRSSNLTEYVKVEYAGHAQSFDVASDFVSLGDGSKIDQMYFNMFPTPQYSSDFDMSMAGYRGFGYNKFTSNGDTIYPEKSIAFDSNGKFSLLLDRTNYLSNGSVNESSFYSKVKSVGSNSNYLINPEIAVDEANNRVAFVSGKTVYLHSLSRLKAQETGSLISTFKTTDSKQGVELDGNYLYIWTGEIGGAFVISKYDVTTGTKVKTATIDLTKYYTGLGRTKHEAEGISIYNGEIYVCAVSRTSSDTKIDIYQITGMN